MSWSVIVPAYQASATLGALLDSVERELGDGVEVVVVDDASTDDTSAIALSRAGIILVRLAENRGPGHARNAGVEASSQDDLLFLDADLVLCEGFGATLERGWAELPSPRVLVGMLALHPAEDHVFARYKAAHMYSYTQAFLRQTRGVGANFTTQCGAVERQLFEGVGGFREDPSITWIEDDELGYRLAEHATIHLVLGLEVSHHFDGFSRATAKIIRQARLWSRHYLERRPRFDAVGKTSTEAVNKLAAGALAPCLLLSMLWDRPLPLLLSVLALGLFLATSRDLVRLCWREHGPLFAGQALVMHAAVGSAATLGAALGLVHRRGR